MHSLPASFALWRIQADTVANLLAGKRMKRQAKKLKSILKLLDHVWMQEYGELYVGELLRLIDLHEKSAELLANADKSGEAAETQTPANDDDLGLVLSSSLKGEMP